MDRVGGLLSQQNVAFADVGQGYALNRYAIEFVEIEPECCRRFPCKREYFGEICVPQSRQVQNVNANFPVLDPTFAAIGGKHKCVRSCASVKPVVTVATCYRVLSRTTFDNVIVFTAVENVVTLTPEIPPPLVLA